MRYVAYTSQSFKKSRYYDLIPESYREDFDILTRVLHFKTNNYVLDNLIDWQNFDHDPMVKLIFPNKEMMMPSDFEKISNQIATDADNKIIQQESIRARKHLYPVGEKEYYKGIKAEGIYHLFPKSLELFPVKASTCHAYCTYCHRWMPLVDTDTQFSYSNHHAVEQYLKYHPEIEEVIFSGGDPLIMSTENIKKAVAPLLHAPHIKTIRFVTKSLAWWPFRYTEDQDAGELLDFFRTLSDQGVHVTLLTHFSHPRELDSDDVKLATQRLLAAGVILRSQGPIAKHINDSPATLSALWSKQIQLGIVPYYLFVDFNYGPIEYFKIPIAQVVDIAQQALQLSSSLVKTIRAPVISDKLMKVSIEGVSEINGVKHFVLKCLSSHKNEDIGKVFFEPYSEKTYRLTLTGLAGFSSHYSHLPNNAMANHPNEQENIENY